MGTGNDSGETPAKEKNGPKPKWYQPATDFCRWIGRGFTNVFRGLNYASPALTGIATVLLAWIALLQWIILTKTDETLTVQQRAWLTPIEARINQGPLKKDEAIRFIISFSNAGREPARGVKARIQNRTIDAYDPKNTDMASIDVPENTACKGLKPELGRSVFGPTGDQTARGTTFASIHGDPYLVANDALVSGSRFYVVNGCAAYLTQGREHQASFCYVLESQFAAVPNPPPQPGTHEERVWYFVTCAKGFDSN